MLAVLCVQRAVSLMLLHMDSTADALAVQAQKIGGMLKYQWHSLLSQ